MIILKQLIVKKSLFKNIFLSVSTSKDYYIYSKLNFIHSILGTITSTISTQALLLSLGLSSAHSLSISSSLNWLIKDGFGLLGGVAFSSLGSAFDTYPKKYRFYGSFLIQFSSFLEIFTLLLPSMFLPLASLSNIGKNIGWLSLSATRAAIHKGFSSTDNLGDITAKAGAQSTAAGLIGTLLGISISWSCGSFIFSDSYSLLLLFLPFSALNLALAWASNRVVITRNLSPERCELAIRGFIQNLTTFQSQNSLNKTTLISNINNSQNLILTPEIVANLESFIYYKSKFKIPLHLEPIYSNLSIHQIQMIQEFPLKPYRIIFSSTNVSLWYMDTATQQDLAIGYIHACLIRYFIEIGLHETQDILKKSLEIMDHLQDIPQLLEKKGWDITNSHLGDANRRLMQIKQF